MMNTCFVIQPFDGGRFDKRYEDIYAPAITAGNLVPYRVDHDPAVNIPIEEIENGIRNATICLADITLDNPNVWFELGFAIAEQKEVILVCGAERSTPFPFDVQHRKIIKYSSESPRDFERLKTDISRRLSAAVEKQVKLTTLSTASPLEDVDGLNQYELITLASVAENLSAPNDNVSAWIVIQEIEKNGFTRTAALLGLRSLSQKNLIEAETLQDYNGEEYIGYSILVRGWDWITQNQDKFALRQSFQKQTSEGSLSDDIPF